MKSVVLFAALFALLVASWPGRQPAHATGEVANARLANLEIDIWPEFDRPSVLVILRGEIAEDATLPAEISLRIPTSAGGPQALASAPSANAQLINLTYERTDVQIDFTTLTFTTPDRFIHLEFYDRLRTDGADRSYSYIWPGDLAVEQLSAQVQEPAGSTGLSVQPELGARTVIPEGLAYRDADLGAFEAGKPQIIKVQYQKTDSRTSAEILGLETANQQPSGEGTGSGDDLPAWWPVAAVVAAVGIGAGAFVVWRRRGRPARGSSDRPTRAERRRRGVGVNASVCQRCGAQLRSRDRFCPECGASAGKG
jgi:hypothetical protein